MRLVLAVLIVGCGRTATLGGWTPPSATPEKGCPRYEPACVTLELTMPEKVRAVVREDARSAPVTLQDGLGTHPVMLGAGGRFNAPVSARLDREVTTVCVTASGCASPDRSACYVFRPSRPLAVKSLSPGGGSMLSSGVTTVSFVGELTAPAARVDIGGVAARVVGTSFQAEVPVQPGLNVVRVALGAASGETSVERLVLGVGPLPVRVFELSAVFYTYAVGRDTVTVEGARDGGTIDFELLLTTGQVTYRLVDDAGVELFRAGVRNLGPVIYEHPPCPYDSDGQTSAMIPALREAETLEILYPGNQVVGRAPFWEDR